MSEVTLLIRRAQQGDREAGERAFVLRRDWEKARMLLAAALK